VNDTGASDASLAPTRVRILRHIADADRPVSVADLTAAFGLNHNTVREHLARLRDDALVTAAVESERDRPGRPRLVYRATAEAFCAIDGDAPYERLSSLLLDALATGDDPVAVGRRAATAPTTRSVEPMTRLTKELARQGFDPTVADEHTVVLHRCPFAVAAARDPRTVCRLHLGLAQGLADAIGGIRVDDLVPTDPARAACRVILTRT
jgi:predicted ArsR family transcriptional regulator